MPPLPSYDQFCTGGSGTIANPEDNSGTTFINCSEGGVGTLQYCPWDTIFYEEYGACFHDCVWIDNFLACDFSGNSNPDDNGFIYSQPLEVEGDCHRFSQCIIGPFEGDNQDKFLMCEMSCPKYVGSDGTCQTMEFDTISHVCEETQFC